MNIGYSKSQQCQIIKTTHYVAVRADEKAGTSVSELSTYLSNMPPGTKLVEVEEKGTMVTLIFMDETEVAGPAERQP